MAKVIGNFPSLLYDALKAEGFILPNECAEVRLLMPIEGLFQLNYTVNLTDEDLVKVGRALARIGATDAKR